jgi:hypothetical protein
MICQYQEHLGETVLYPFQPNTAMRPGSDGAASDESFFDFATKGACCWSTSHIETSGPFRRTDSQMQSERAKQVE